MDEIITFLLQLRLRKFINPLRFPRRTSRWTRADRVLAQNEGQGDWHMAVLDNKSLGISPSKGETSIITTVQISASIRTQAPCLRQPIPARLPRPGSVRTTSAIFVTYEQRSCAFAIEHDTNGALT